MAGEARFYPPPQPTQGIRYAPIPAQGDQPPKRTIAAAMSVIISCWPTGLEYQAPQRAVTVPIPKQGDQPPKSNPAAMYSVVGQSWPTGFEHQPWQRLKTTPIPAQGDQPPPMSMQRQCCYQYTEPPQPQQRLPQIAAIIPVTVSAQPAFTRLSQVVLQSWEPQSSIPALSVEIAPLLLPYGDQPPRMSQAVFRSIVEQHQPPAPQPTQRATTAPIPTQGDQPPRCSAVNLQTILSAWTPPDPQPQRDLKNFAPLTLVYGSQPPPYSRVIPRTIVTAWQPPDPQPTQRAVTLPIAAQGDQPPPQIEQLVWQVVDAWPQQRQAQVAAIIPAVVVAQPPFAPLPDVVLRAWQAVDQPIQRLTTLPIPVQGDQPPRCSAVNLVTILQSWTPPDPQPQRDLKRSIPATQGDQPPRSSGVTLSTIVTAWQPPDPEPTQAAKTRQIVSVDNPPPQPDSLAYPVEQIWPQQRQQQIAALIPAAAAEQPPFARLPASIIASWQVDAAPQQIRATIPIPAQGDQPPRFSNATLNAILRAWEPPDPLPSRPVQIAPLTLTYGDRPPPYSRVTPRTIVGAWYPDYVAPQGPLAFVAAIIPPVVATQPPFSRQSELILTAWQPADPIPTRPKPFVFGATRLYLPATAVTVSFNPLPDAAWEDTTLLARVKTSPVRINDTLATVSFADNNAADKDVLFRQFISPRLVAGQIITGSQLVKAQARVSEVSATNNMFLTIGVRVIAENGVTVQKTVLNVTRDDVESVTALTNRQFTATSTATDYTSITGDRLVIEFGMGGDPGGGADHDSSIRFGDSGATDLAEEDTSTTDNNPWIQFTDHLNFEVGDEPPFVHAGRNPLPRILRAWEPPDPRSSGLCSVALVPDQTIITYVETFNETTVWVCPPGITSIKCEAWGCSGNGGGGSAAGGGGGGAYAAKNVYPVTEGTGYTVSVAIVQGGVKTYFDSITTGIAADFGLVGTIGSGGTGGLASNSIGDTTFNGGNGGNAAGTSGGGGGGSGDAAGAGNNGANGSGGTGGAGGAAVGTGGAGGNGGNAGAPGNPGSAPGGAGGGAGGIGQAAGAGSAGRVMITYLITESGILSCIFNDQGGVDIVDGL